MAVSKEMPIWGGQAEGGQERPAGAVSAARAWPLDRLRRRLLFLDDPTALLHLGFAVAMASLLLGLSLGMAWVLVEFVLS
jgi:hypothetical protein